MEGREERGIAGCDSESVGYEDEVEDVDDAVAVHVVLGDCLNRGFWDLLPSNTFSKASHRAKNECYLMMRYTHWGSLSPSLSAQLISRWSAEFGPIAFYQHTDPLDRKPGFYVVISVTC